MSEIPRINERVPSLMPDGHWIDNHDSEVWIKDGKYHRTDGPAAITMMGSKSWFKNGKRHRNDGPAIVFANGGGIRWYLNGDYYYHFEHWLEANDEISDSKKLFLKLKYG